MSIVEEEGKIRLDFVLYLSFSYLLTALAMRYCQRFFPIANIGCGLSTDGEPPAYVVSELIEKVCN